MVHLASASEKDIRLHFSLTTLNSFFHLSVLSNIQSDLIIQLCAGFVLAYLKVSEYVQADPVAVRVRDEAQAHVGSGVVEVTNKIHRLRAAFRTQHGVQFSGPDHLIGGSV